MIRIGSVLAAAALVLLYVFVVIFAETRTTQYGRKTVIISPSSYIFIGKPQRTVYARTHATMHRYIMCVYNINTYNHTYIMIYLYLLYIYNILYLYLRTK